MVHEWAAQGLQILLTVVYAAVGVTVLKRRPVGEGRLAATAFAGWWILLAGANLGGTVDAVVRAAGAWSLAAYLAYTQMILLVIVIALACLMYYLLYLFTGKRSAWVGIALAYFAYYVAILLYLAYAAPEAIDQDGGSTRLVYARDLDGHWSTTVLGVLLIAPPLAGALAYFSLLLRVPERTQRFRIATVGGAFIVWFGVSLLASQFSDVSGRSWWPVVSAVVALAASLAVYVAFRPPAWVRQRLRVTGYGEA